MPGFLVVYGVSRVEGSWWENPGAAVLGYEPVDEVDPELRRALAARAGPGKGRQGGRFASREYWIEP